MESKHLSYFKVENFKRFDSLEVKDIGQFNLIVGDNNVGKTTLLEALLFDEDFQRWQMNLWEVLRTYRDIPVQDNKGIHFLDYFLKEKNAPLRISFILSDSDIPNHIKVATRVIESLNSEEIQELQRAFNFRTRVKLLTEFNLNSIKKIEFIPNESESIFFLNNLPYLSYYYLNDSLAIEAYSSLAIDTQKKAEFINDLSYFIPNLSDLEINYALVPDRPVIAIREVNRNLLPLSQYGDGTSKLFRYLLELERFQRQRLMIDEIDTGIHYSRMKDFLKKVIQTAKNKNVQIFATTHSRECLQFYTQALEELGMQGEGRIIRLADTKKGIKAYTMRFAEFDDALSIENEIR